MFLMAIVESLEAAGIGVFGTNLFASTYPTTAPNKCVVVRDNGGPMPSKEIPTETRMIQFVSRSDDPYEAEAAAYNIHRLFHGQVNGLGVAAEWAGKHNYIVGTTDPYYVYSNYSLQLPSDISPDEKGRFEYSFNISFKIKAKER